MAILQKGKPPDRYGKCKSRNESADRFETPVSKIKDLRLNTRITDYAPKKIVFKDGEELEIRDILHEVNTDMPAETDGAISCRPQGLIDTRRPCFL